MAKKVNLQEMPVEDKLKNLYNLQKLLTEIDRLRTLRGELPLEVQDIEDDVEGLTTRISNQKAEVERYNNDIAAYKGKIAECELLVERYKAQLDEVRNNREYDTLSKEIDFQSLEIEFQQKRIRKAEAGRTEAETEVARCQEKLETRQNDLLVKRTELEEIVEETKMEEEKLREDAKTLEGKIEPRLLLAFKRIRKSSRNGLGVVYVQRDACGGCFNKIPPQRQIDIRERKKIIVCEYCGRIMIDPELAGIKPVQPKTTTRKRATRKKVTKEAETEA